MSSPVGSWTGSTLEDWLKLLAGDATRYWQVHIRYYWACWIFGTDPRKPVSLNKRDSLKHAGVSQQTLEQRSSLWNWPIAEHTFMTAQQLLGIIPQLNSTWSHIHVCCQPLLMEPLCKTTVTAEVIVAIWHRRWQPDCPVPFHEHCSFALPEIVLYLRLYNTQLPTITNYYHSWSLRPAPLSSL